jgi:hypothetical protein
VLRLDYRQSSTPLCNRFDSERLLAILDESFSLLLVPIFHLVALAAACPRPATHLFGSSNRGFIPAGEPRLQGRTDHIGIGEWPKDLDCFACIRTSPLATITPLAYD